jgi:radical SAM-linked protein
VDFELTEAMAEAEFGKKLAEQLPVDVPIFKVEEVGLKAASATQLLEKAEYILVLAHSNTEQNREWQKWIELVEATDTILWEQLTKSGKKKVVNLCEQLFELEIVEAPVQIQAKVLGGEGRCALRYVGSSRNDGTLLRPEHLVYMLQQVSGQEVDLLHVHRAALILAE